VLGARPAQPVRRAVWKQAARRIERFRQEGGLSQTETAIGAEPGPSAIARRAWRHLCETTLEARERLGFD